MNIFKRKPKYTKEEVKALREYLIKQGMGEKTAAKFKHGKSKIKHAEQIRKAVRSL